MAFRDQPLGELALTIPRASALFRQYDMDYCCGGKQTLARAASRKALDVAVIEAELAKLAEQPLSRDWRAAPLAEIIDHIIVRYHDRHREQLPELILQATKVERVHADKPNVPKGLTKYLTNAASGAFQPHDERGADPVPDDQTGNGRPGRGADQRDGKRA